jgi:hypothetical protein
MSSPHQVAWPPARLLGDAWPLKRVIIVSEAEDYRVRVYIEQFSTRKLLVQVLSIDEFESFDVANEKTDTKWLYIFHGTKVKSEDTVEPRQWLAINFSVLSNTS